MCDSIRKIIESEMNEMAINDILRASIRPTELDYPIDLKSLNFSTKTFVFKVGDYECRLRLPDFKIISRLKGSDEDKFALAINGDVFVNCDCPDYKYRFKYVASQYDFAIRKEKRPPRHTNPNYDGTICKHLGHLLQHIEDHKSEMLTLYDRNRK
jgi:hypothetical protein